MYLERRWRRALGDDHDGVLALNMSDLRAPDFGARLWPFLGLPITPVTVPCNGHWTRNCTNRPPLGAAPSHPVDIGGGKRKNFSFGSFDGVPIPAAPALVLRSFYRTFDPSVFDFAF